MNLTQIVVINQRVDLPSPNGEGILLSSFLGDETDEFPSQGFVVASHRLTAVF